MFYCRDPAFAGLSSSAKASEDKKNSPFREHFTFRLNLGIDCRCNLFSYPKFRIAGIKTVVKAWFSKVFHRQ
ncbi:MAG: hypothetical protein COY66_01920 [Candidatus Kerfeldbacteria bacterium CG_4_10_14_0_8_um_filter_42_10]|uniref:Uncharacterized protein n=1 Tax=Candidatus Kerfeldbacteria bacterium CG_4_10_14_0_8_um_filter_42_10 TaxID=2014248 RepID=A0A2M7RKK0_9BACT|nr:MAG: hypothetical protein COY66_01920 [Candidatus Kerfeldbacteria bacterium CG_4_10_14_0_8_um_filter_42_10]